MKPTWVKRGEGHHRARLTKEKVLKIREEHKHGASINELSKKYRVSYNTVRSVVLKKSWRHVQ